MQEDTRKWLPGWMDLQPLSYETGLVEGSTRATQCIAYNFASLLHWEINVELTSDKIATHEVS